MRMPLFRPRQGVFNGAIQFFADVAHVAIDFGPRWPIRRRVRWQSAADGVNSECEQLIESRMKGAQSERALGQQIPVKRLDMADVKYDAVALGNRPVVYCVFPNQLEDFVGSRAGIKQARVEVVPEADGGSECSHGVYPFFDAALERRMRQKSASGG